MRPLIQTPTWDGKLVLAGIFIIGYYGLVFSMARIGLPVENKEIVRDAMLTLGPPIGVIVGALFRSTGAEERRDVLRSAELQKAIEAPTVAATNGTSLEEATANGVERGLARAEPVRVEPAKPAPSPPEPLAADGERRDWLDPPAPPPVEEAEIAPVDVGSTPVMED